MRVHINTFANLRDYSPEGKGSFELTLADGASIQNLLEIIGVPPQVDAVILVNGRRAVLETTLYPDDTLTLFPPMEGG